MKYSKKKSGHAYKKVNIGEWYFKGSAVKWHFLNNLEVKLEQQEHWKMYIFNKVMIIHIPP